MESHSENESFVPSDCALYPHPSNPASGHALHPYCCRPCGLGGEDKLCSLTCERRGRETGGYSEKARGWRCVCVCVCAHAVFVCAFLRMSLCHPSASQIHHLLIPRHRRSVWDNKQQRSLFPSFLTSQPAPEANQTVNQQSWRKQEKRWSKWRLTMGCRVRERLELSDTNVVDKHFTRLTLGKLFKMLQQAKVSHLCYLCLYLLVIFD